MNECNSDPFRNIGVIEVTKISSRDRNLQRTSEQMLDDSVDAVRPVSHGRVQQQTAKHMG